MSWIRPNKRPKPSLYRAPHGPRKGVQTGSGPHLTKPGQGESEHFGFSDFDKIFDDYNDNTIRPGMPFSESAFDPNQFELEVMAAASKRLRTQFEQMTAKVDDPSKKEFLEFAVKDLNIEPLQLWVVRHWAKNPAIFTELMKSELLHVDNLYEISDDIRKVDLGKTSAFSTSYNALKRARNEFVSESRRSQHHIVPVEGTKVMEFEDGWAWWDLGKAISEEEGTAMGHCGNRQGDADRDNDRILSLRKSVGKFYVRPSLTFVVNNGWLREMKGRENNKPDPDYHPYIIDLIKQPTIRGLWGGGFKPMTNFDRSDLDAKQQEQVQASNPDIVWYWHTAPSAVKRQRAKELSPKILATLDIDTDFVKSLDKDWTEAEIRELYRKSPLQSVSFFSDKLDSDKIKEAIDRSINDDPQQAWTQFAHLIEPDQKKAIIKGLVQGGRSNRTYPVFTLVHFYNDLTDASAKTTLKNMMGQYGGDDIVNLWNQFRKQLKPGHRTQLAQGLAQSTTLPSAILDARGFLDSFEQPQREKLIEKALEMSPVMLLRRQQQLSNERSKKWLLSPEQVKQALDVVLDQSSYRHHVLDLVSLMSPEQKQVAVTRAMNRENWAQLLTKAPDLLDKKQLATAISAVLKDDPEWAVLNVRGLLSEADFRATLKNLAPEKIIEHFSEELEPQERDKIINKLAKTKPMWLLDSVPNLSDSVIQKAIEHMFDNEQYGYFWERKPLWGKATPAQLNRAIREISHHGFITQYQDIAAVLDVDQLNVLVSYQYRALMDRQEEETIIGKPEIFGEERVQRALSSLVESRPKTALARFMDRLSTDQIRGIVNGANVEQIRWMIEGDIVSKLPDQIKAEFVDLALSKKAYETIIRYHDSIGATKEQVRKAIDATIENNPTWFDDEDDVLKGLDEDQRQRLEESIFTVDPIRALRISKDPKIQERAIARIVSEEDETQAQQWLYRNREQYTLSEERTHKIALNLLNREPLWILLRDDTPSSGLSQDEIDAAIKKLNSRFGGRHSLTSILQSQLKKIMSPELLVEMLEAEIAQDPVLALQNFKSLMSDEQKQRSSQGVSAYLIKRIRDEGSDADDLIPSYKDFLTQDDIHEMAEIMIEKRSGSYNIRYMGQYLSPEQKMRAVEKGVDQNPEQIRTWYENDSFDIRELLTPEQRERVGLTPEAELQRLLQHHPFEALSTRLDDLNPDQRRQAIGSVIPKYILDEADIWNNLTQEEHKLIIEDLVENYDSWANDYWHLLSPEQKQRINPSRLSEEGETRQASTDLKVNTPPKCAYCKKPMRLFEDRKMLQCPHCRRELAVEVDRQRFNYDKTRETTGAEVAMAGPSPHDMSFDHQKYQTRLPGDLY